MKTKRLTILDVTKTMLVVSSLLMLTCCNGLVSQTPDEDTTMLWPAADSTGLWGFINDKGRMVIPAKYGRTYGFSGGLAKVVIAEDGQPLPAYYGYQANIFKYKQAFVNTKGKIVYTLPDDMVL